MQLLGHRTRRARPHNEISVDLKVHQVGGTLELETRADAMKITQGKAGADDRAMQPAVDLPEFAPAAGVEVAVFLTSITHDMTLLLFEGRIKNASKSHSR